MKGRDFILLGCSPFFNGGFVNKVFTQIFSCVCSCVETLMGDYRSAAVHRPSIFSLKSVERV